MVNMDILLFDAQKTNICFIRDVGNRYPCH